MYSARYSIDTSGPFQVHAMERRLLDLNAESHGGPTNLREGKRLMCVGGIVGRDNSATVVKTDWECVRVAHACRCTR
jgi:hypothetical protein